MISKRATYVLALFIVITVLSMAIRPNLVPSGVTRLAPSSLHRSSLPIVDKTFLLLKTGSEVAYGRLPPHTETTLKRWPHHAVYADSNDTVSGIPMVDCLSFLPDETLNDPAMKGYRIRRQLKEQHWNWGNEQILVDGRQTGWDLDRFKNIPAYAEAWSRRQDLDWYVMIDADSYLAAYTLSEVVKGHNPDEVSYFGKAVGWGFAHGGSGIVLSRGAMREIFGTTKESIHKQLVDTHRPAIDDCCGDAVVARRYEAATQKDTRDTLQDTEFGQFQGARTPATLIKLGDQWCKPVGTFHGLKQWEIYLLDAWEKRAEAEKKTMTYADFYQEFYMPYIRPEVRNWKVVESRGEANMRTWKKDDIEAKEKHKCYEACLADEECTEWSFIGGESCTIFRDLVLMGEAMNKFKGGWDDKWTEVSTGFMVDRIRDRRLAQPCDGLHIEASDLSKREGWFWAELKKAGRDSLDVMDYKSTELAISSKVKKGKPVKHHDGPKHGDGPHGDDHGDDHDHDHEPHDE